LMLASGDLCDFTHCWTEVDIEEAGEDGAFLPLRDYVEGSALLSSRYNDNQLQLMTHDDGNIYYLRAIAGLDPAATSIRMDIIGQYTDGKVPANLDEYMDVFKKAKADGLSTYPWWEAGNYFYWIQTIFQAYGTQYKGWQYYTPADGWIAVVDNPTYREAIEYCVECYKEGLVDPAFATTDGNTANGQMYYNNYLFKRNNLGSVAWMDTAPYEEATDLNGTDPKTVDWMTTIMPLAVTDNYIEEIATALPRPAATGWHGMSIWAGTKDVDACIRLVEAFVSDEVAEMTAFGLEGLDHTRDGDNYIMAEDAADRTYKSAYGFGWSYYSTKHLQGNGATKATLLPEDIRDAKHKEMVDEMWAIIDDAQTRDAVTPGTITIIADDAIKTRSGNCQEESTSILLKIIVGDLTIDDGYAQLKALYDSYSDVTDAHNEAYNAVRADYGF